MIEDGSRFGGPDGGPYGAGSLPRMLAVSQRFLAPVFKLKQRRFLKFVPICNFFHFIEISFSFQVKQGLFLRSPCLLLLDHREDCFFIFFKINAAEEEILLEQVQDVKIGT